MVHKYKAGLTTGHCLRTNASVQARGLCINTIQCFVFLNMCMLDYLHFMLAKVGAAA